MIFDEIDSAENLLAMPKDYLLLMIDSLKKENALLRTDNQRLKILLTQGQSKT